MTKEERDKEWCSNHYLRVYHFLLSEKLADTAKVFENEAKEFLKGWIKKNKKVKDRCLALQNDIEMPIIPIDNTTIEMSKTLEEKNDEECKNHCKFNDFNENDKNIITTKPRLPGYEPPKFVKATTAVSQEENRSNPQKTLFVDNEENDSSSTESNDEKEKEKERKKRKREECSKEKKKEKMQKEESPPPPPVNAIKEEKKEKEKEKKREKEKKEKKEESNNVKIEKFKENVDNNYEFKGISISNKPFQRIDSSKVEFNNDRLRSNHFLDKEGAAGSYGEKAFKDLAPTRGKEFRQEKNKKKKGTYKGGRITTQIHSIKFNDSDDE